MAITISQIYSLRLRCGQYLLQAVQSFQLSHNKRELSVSDIKKKKNKLKIKILMLTMMIIKVTINQQLHH